MRLIQAGTGQGWRGLGVGVALCFLACATPEPVSGQQAPSSPRIAFIYPAGGQRGTTFTVTVGGVLFDGAYDAVISGEGVTATVLDRSRPMSQASSLLLVDQMKALKEKRKNARLSGLLLDAHDRATLDEIQKMFASFPPLNRANPGLGETVTLTVSIDADAAPGDRDLRLRTTAGMTNPRTFQVGYLPEAGDPPAKTERRFERGDGQKSVASTESSVTLPVLVNGQILQGGVDRYRFQATRGVKLVIAASARGLIPYLPDAVPGWFQAMLTLYDASGRELAYADHFEFHPDPVIYYEIPAVGEYVVEIRDSIYRGREDFVYRLAMGELPYITGVYPLGAQRGSKTRVELMGWNLPASSTTVDTASWTGSRGSVSVMRNGMVSNILPFALSDAPETAEKEPNNTREAARHIQMPAVINGRIAAAEDQDLYQFDVPAGTKVLAEVFARRLENPLDSFVTISDASGAIIASNDDNEDKSQGLDTHHADSRVVADLSAGGRYFVTVSDTQHQGGAKYSYRLTLGSVEPDFDLRVTPSSLNIKGRNPVSLSVYALRKNGFSGAIQLALKNAPTGYSLSENSIPAGTDKLDLTLSAPPGLRDQPTALFIEGIADIAGRQIVREAVPAEDMMQAFAYRHLVPVNDLLVDAMGRLPDPYNPKLLSFSHMDIPHGQAATLRVAIPGYIARLIEFKLVSPQQGISLGKIKTGPEAEIEILCAAEHTQVGQNGEIRLAMFHKPIPILAGKNKDKKQQQGELEPVNGAIPVVSYKIVPPLEKTAEPPTP